MILSFFLEEDILSDGIKIWIISWLESTENPPFRFFWDTRYKCTSLSKKNMSSDTVRLVHWISFVN